MAGAVIMGEKVRDILTIRQALALPAPLTPEEAVAEEVQERISIIKIRLGPMAETVGPGLC